MDTPDFTAASSTPRGPTPAFLSHALAWSVLGLGLLASCALSWRVLNEAENDAAFVESVISDQLSRELADRFRTIALALRAGAGLIAEDLELTPRDWRVYVGQLDPQLSTPGLLGVGYIERVPDALRAMHEDKIRSSGFPDYRIRPDGQRDLYAPVTLIEPLRGRNLIAFGYDMYSDPVRRSAMDAAQDSGWSTISGRVELLQETGDPVEQGMVLYYPVYAETALPTTIQERRTAILGWTYAPLHLKELLAGLLEELPEESVGLIDLALYDGSTAQADKLLFDTHAEREQQARTNSDSSFTQRSIEFNDQHLLLTLDFSSMRSDLDYFPAFGLLGGGVLASLSLFGLLLSLQGSRARAERLAASLTTDILARDAELRESELRWKYALEGAGDGVWDWNLTNNQVYFSPRWKKMLGFEELEIGNSLDDWKQRVHPEDLARTMDDVRACLSGATADYRNEHRVQCKDGSYKWVLDRGKVVLRDNDGKPLRMIGTHADIDENKRNELQLRQTLELLAGMHKALDHLEIYVFTKDSQGRYTYANKHTLTLFGRALEEVKGHGDDEFFPNDALQRIREIDRRVLSGESTVEQVEVAGNDGPVCYLEAKTPLRSESGTITGLCGITMDITAIRRLEAELQQRERELQEAQRIALISNWKLDLASEELTWSRQLYELFGLRMESPLPKLSDHQKMFTEESWQRMVAATEKARIDGHPFELEVEAVSSHGERRWLLTRAEAERDHSGKIKALRGIVQDVTERKLADQSIAQISGFYATLSAFNQLIINSKNADDLYRDSCRIMSNHDGLDLVWIGLLEKDGTSLAPAHCAGEHQDIVNSISKGINASETSSHGAYAQAVRENRPVWLEYLPQNPTSAHEIELANSPGWLSSAALPIRRAGKPIGIIGLYSTTLRRYDEEMRKLLIEMSDVISAALDKLDAESLAYQGAAELEKVFLQTVGLATNLVELRDPYTAGHVRRVSVLSEAIGKELGLEPARVQGLRVAGFLYDIGKILIPAEILAKPGKLTTVELQLIRQHTRAGFNLLQHMDFPWPVAQVALHHHERLDGSGYPDGLKGDSIPLEARIVGLADVVLAMSSHRPWRAALPLEQALAEIEQNKGTLYDAAVVDACLRLFRDQHFTV